MPLPHLTGSLCRDENTSSGPFSSLDKLEQHLISRHIMKPEIEIIEIEEEEQTEVNQERGQTSQDDLLEFAWLELEQTHNSPVIDQTSPEAVSDLCHSSLPVSQPTLSSLINQLFDISEESIKEQKVAPNSDLGHFSRIASHQTAVKQERGETSQDVLVVARQELGQNSARVNHFRANVGQKRDVERGKRHQCQQCDYATNDRSHLTRHIRTHTGEKPFKCKRCNYATTQKSNLISHELTHTGERPFKCKKAIMQQLITEILSHMNAFTPVKNLINADFANLQQLITAISAHICAFIRAKSLTNAVSVNLRQEVVKV